MSKIKNYGGLLDEEGKKERDLLILEMRSGKTSFRDIATEIEAVFGLSVSYVTLRSYWKEQCNGEALEGVLKDAEKGKGGGIIKPAFDQEVFKRVSESYKDRGELGNICAKILTLVRSNVDAHINGEETLKSHYLKCLKDVESMLKK